MSPSGEQQPSAAGASRAPFKLGPEAPTVTRLSRKALAAAGIIAGLGIGGSLIYALAPTPRKVGQEVYATDGRARADVLGSAPKDYSQVPQLGPPLPGDLGKPILSAQRDGRDGSPMMRGQQSAQPMDAAAAARQRARQERESARASQLFTGHGGVESPSGQQASINLAAIATPPDALAEPATAPAGPGTGNAAKRAFLAHGGDTRSTASAVIEYPSSASLLQAGSIIPAALITGIRSDLPGQITAQVTQNIYDSPTGHLLLVPQGARLIGEYDSQVDAGQTRLLMAWTRLILPSGASIRLEREPGADASGFSGLQDGVDNHWGGVAHAAMISTLLGLGTELAAGSDADIVRALRRGSQDTFNQAGQQIVQKQLAVSPTLTIRPGHPLRVMVTRDLVLSPLGRR